MGAHEPFWAKWRKPKWHPIHQREVPEFVDEFLPFIVGGPRVSAIRRALGYEAPPASSVRQTGALVPAPRTQDTEGMRRLPPAAPDEERKLAWEDVTTVKSLQRSRYPWLFEQPPDHPVNALPVERQPVASDLPGKVTERPGKERVDAALATLRAEHPRQEDCVDPDTRQAAIAELPTMPRRDFSENSWLLAGSNIASLSFSGELPPFDPPTLVPLSSGEIAAVDKHAGPGQPGALMQLEELASQPPDDDTLEVPTLIKQKIEERK